MITGNKGTQWEAWQQRIKNGWELRHVSIEKRLKTGNVNWEGFIKFKLTVQKVFSRNIALTGAAIRRLCSSLTCYNFHLPEMGYEMCTNFGNQFNQKTSKAYKTIAVATEIVSVMRFYLITISIICLLKNSRSQTLSSCEHNYRRAIRLLNNRRNVLWRQFISK